MFLLLIYTLCVQSISCLGLLKHLVSFIYRFILINKSLWLVLYGWLLIWWTVGGGRSQHRDALRCLQVWMGVLATFKEAQRDGFKKAGIRLRAGSKSSRKHWAEGQRFLRRTEEFDLCLHGRLTPSPRSEQTKKAPISAALVWRSEDVKKLMMARFLCLDCSPCLLLFYSAQSSSSFSLFYYLTSFVPAHFVLLFNSAVQTSLNHFSQWNTRRWTEYLCLMSFLTLSDRRFISLTLNPVTAERSQRWDRAATPPKYLI